MAATDWTAVLRCPAGHMFEASKLHVNVDGHIVVPLPLCSKCLSSAQPSAPQLSRREVRRWERTLRRQIGEL